MRLYGDVMKSVREWISESVSDSLLFDALADGVSDLWEQEIRVQLSNFLQGPLNVSFAAGDERATIISIADPTINTLNVTSVAGSAIPARTYAGAHTWVTESGSETLVCSVGTWAINNNELLKADAPSANPPTGAVGWNFYVRIFDPTTPTMRKVNAQPITIRLGGSLASFTEPAGGFDLNDTLPAPPDANTTGDNIAYISHLEVQTPDQTYKAWEQAEIDSTLMRCMAGRIAGASQYQPYAFDLLNNTTLEIRPAAGMALNPRYFFVVRPRRSISKNAPLPFPSEGEEAYIRYRALSLLSLKGHEYGAAEKWDEKAGQKISSILLALNQQNRRRSNTIRPYTA